MRRPYCNIAFNRLTCRIGQDAWVTNWPTNKTRAQVAELREGIDSDYHIAETRRLGGASESWADLEWCAATTYRSISFKPADACLQFMDWQDAPENRDTVDPLVYAVHDPNNSPLVLAQRQWRAQLQVDGDLHWALLVLWKDRRRCMAVFQHHASMCVANNLHLITTLRYRVEWQLDRFPLIAFKAVAAKSRHASR